MKYREYLIFVKRMGWSSFSKRVLHVDKFLQFYNSVHHAFSQTNKET